MRKKRLVWNTFSSVFYRLAVVACGFILPRLILEYYGSETNGLVNSITQFLSIISFLELGVGAVVESSLYKPLAEKDSLKISQIMVSANKFFKRLAGILLVYILILLFAYPQIANSSYDWMYTATLILAISISSFAQYYFGVVDRLLLIADQRGYIQYWAMFVTLIVNTVACVILMKAGCSIQVVKLTTSLIYLARPFVVRIYVNRHYDIDRRAVYEKEPIEQKWNGVAQHVAAVVLDGTDNAVLTLFATLSDVSIYSVYFSVVNGVKLLLMSTTDGIQAVLGELWAKKEYEALKKTFNAVEWAMHTATVFVFGCTIMLILPFVSVYTSGINDANYIQPVFAILIVLANAGHCLRLPYNMMILAAGHYKQTQHNYIVAACLNIFISIVMVNLFGLVGVAIGTLVAMVYQTLWMAIYNARHLVIRSFFCFCKQLLVDVLCFALSVVLINIIGLHAKSYFSWFSMAGITALVWGLILFIVNYALNRENINYAVKVIRKSRGC